MKSSPKVLKTKIAQAEAILASTKEASEAIGLDELESATLLMEELKKASTTKVAGTLIRAFTKSSDPDSNRNTVRAEINALRAKFGSNFDYRPYLPKALNAEIDTMISMKRRRP